MIARLIAAIRRVRIEHHERVAAAFGAATLVAQLNRNWAAAAKSMARMHEAQAKRDRLMGEAAWSVRPRPNGDFEVRRP